MGRPSNAGPKQLRSPRCPELNMALLWSFPLALRIRKTCPRYDKPSLALLNPKAP